MQEHTHTYIKVALKNHLDTAKSVKIRYKSVSLLQGPSLCTTAATSKQH